MGFYQKAVRDEPEAVAVAVVVVVRGEPITDCGEPITDCGGDSRDSDSDSGDSGGEDDIDGMSAYKEDSDGEDDIDAMCEVNNNNNNNNNVNAMSAFDIVKVSYPFAILSSASVPTAIHSISFLVFSQVFWVFRRFLGLI